MSLPNDRRYFLLRQWSSQQQTPVEEKELFDWISTHNDDGPTAAFINKMLDEYKMGDFDDAVDWEKLYQRILDGRKSPQNRVIPMRSHFIRWAVAASILVLAGTGIYYLAQNKPDTKPSAPVSQLILKAPQINKATVTLSNGARVSLDSLASGTLAQQGNVQLIKLADGQIAYQSAGAEQSQGIQFNTLSNPRGSKVIDMALSDGSHIWLNAGSSITYPVIFRGEERKVSVDGEAYFEVKHDPSKPFIVTKGGLNVTVLGTKFNINSYDDEENIKVTLLSGSVQTSVAGGESIIIKPEQQAVIRNGQIGISVQQRVDTREVMAWKDGRFDFRNAGIELIMRQIARWYDVDVQFEFKTDKVFMAEIPRNVNAGDFFKILEATGWIHFKIDGRKITVQK